MPKLRDVSGAEPVGVVGRNSVAYLRTVFSALRSGRPVVTLRSDQDEERMSAAGVQTAIVPDSGAGWLGDVAYEPTESEDIAQILFTSGTEGASKGILLSHRALGNTVDRLISVMEMDASIREYVGIPAYYSFGFGRCRAVLAAGGQAYLPPDGFSPVEIVRMLEGGEINAISAVPTLWRLVLGHRSAFESVGERVRWIEIGSQFMGAEEKRVLRELFPNAVIVQHYGLTEASRTTFLRVDLAEEGVLGSVGRPTGGVEVSADLEGILRIRGPHLASGVLRGGVVEPLTGPDGWFRTSDKGHVEDGHVYFHGRADDLINLGGTKLSPDWLERRLAKELSASGAIAVARVPDELRGDGVLVAVLRSADLDTEVVRSAALAALSDAGVHAGSGLKLMECEHFPVTDTGKLRRAALRDEFERSNAGIVGIRPPHDPPRDHVERFLADRFEARFGIERAGLADSILAEGADSLRTVELVADIEAEFGIEISLASLVQGPTLLEIADRVRWAMAGNEPAGFDYVVPLAAGGGPELPNMFIVGGSYGNVLHLHDLAIALADVANVYGIQYRGLLRDDRPRETIEETARDFLGELVEVQPEGPYMLAGYSGGGIIALELARQLLSRGDAIRFLSLIDTRLPARMPYQAPFSMLERQWIRLFDSRRRGEGVAGLLRRAAARLVGLVTGRRPLTRVDHDEAELPPTKLRSERINQAFKRALKRYEIPHLPLRMHYFRPDDEVTYTVASGQIDFVDSEAHRVNGADNGWREYFESVVVRSSPGGHYTLAHAPNAGALARAMRDALGSDH